MINYLRNSNEFSQWSSNRKRNDILKGFNDSIEKDIAKKSFSSISCPASVSNYVPPINNLLDLGGRVDDKKQIIYDLRCEIETKQEEYEEAKSVETTKQRVIIAVVVLIIIGCLFLF